MTNNFTFSPHPSLPDTNDYVDKIHDIFYQHWLILDNERQEAIDKINKWCCDWKRFIDKYADEQIVLLNDDYDRLRRVFDEKHKDNLETANAYHAAQQVDLFNELRDACRLLKFQVATLKFSKYEMERPEVIIVEEHVERKNLEEMNVNNRENARRRRRLKKDNDNETGNTSRASANSPSINSITSTSKQTIDRQSSKTKSEKKNDQSTDDNNDSKTQAMNSDDSNNKCPICFMIFPLSMTRNDRHQHVNEHMVDDQNSNDIRI